MAYTTADDLRSYLGITDTGDDVLLTSLIASAQEMVDSYCGRTFEAAADTTRTFDAYNDVDGATLYLDEDLFSITTVTNGDGVAVSSSEYTTEPRNRAPYYAIRLLPSAGKNWEAQADGDNQDAISVAGRWAWSLTPPADVVQATRRLAAWLYRQRDNADMDRAVVAGTATILPSAIPADVMTFLNPRRRFV